MKRSYDSINECGAYINNAADNICQCKMNRIDSAFGGWLTNLTEVYYCPTHNIYHHCDGDGTCIIVNSVCTRSGTCMGISTLVGVTHDLMNIDSLPAFDRFKLRMMNKGYFWISMQDRLKEELEEAKSGDEGMTMETHFRNKPDVESTLTRLYYYFKRELGMITRGTQESKLEKVYIMFEEMALRLLESRMTNHDKKQKLLAKVSKLISKQNTKSHFTTSVNKLITSDLTYPERIVKPLMDLKLSELYI